MEMWDDVGRGRCGIYITLLTKVALHAVTAYPRNTSLLHAQFQIVKGYARHIVEMLTIRVWLLMGGGFHYICIFMSLKLLSR